MPYSPKRKIKNLLWAEEIDSGPFSNLTKTGRRRCHGTPAQKEGIRFENTLDAHLSSLDLNFLPNQWFQFEDINGDGYCQPDFILFEQKKEIIVILEAKRTWTPNAQEELFGLYAPIVREVYSPRILICVQVFRYFQVMLENSFVGYQEIMDHAQSAPAEEMLNWNFL